MKKAGVDNTLESYDWNTTAQYDRALVRKLMSLEFVEKHLSVLIFGPTGIGKTFLAKHLAFLALKSGYQVLQKTLIKEMEPIVAKIQLTAKLKRTAILLTAL